MNTPPQSGVKILFIANFLIKLLNYHFARPLVHTLTIVLLLEGRECILLYHQFSLLWSFYQLQYVFPYHEGPDWGQ